MNVPDDKAIPETPILRRYLELKEQGGEPVLLDKARAADAATLAREFEESVERFERYDNPEPFHARGRLSQTAGKPKDRIAELLRTSPLEVEGLGTLEYVDYEIVAARTTGEFSHERQGAKLVRNDFLLRRGETPVVAELKTATDRDAYYALVQLLACGAQLATANQRRRLHGCYPELGTDGPLDLLHLVQPRPKPSRDRQELDRIGAALAAELVESGAIADYVGRIARKEIHRP